MNDLFFGCSPCYVTLLESTYCYHLSNTSTSSSCQKLTYIWRNSKKIYQIKPFTKLHSTSDSPQQIQISRLKWDHINCLSAHYMHTAHTVDKLNLVNFISFLDRPILHFNRKLMAVGVKIQHYLQLFQLWLRPAFLGFYFRWKKAFWKCGYVFAALTPQESN